jgi:mycothiol synthase
MIKTLQSNLAAENPGKTLPSGYRMRPATLDDVEATVSMMNDWSRQAIGRENFSVEDVRMEWQEPGYDLENDSRLLIAADGHIAGFEEVFDPGEPHVRIICWGVIAPEHRGMGLDAELLAWAEARARQSIRFAAPRARVVLVGHCLSNQTLTGRLFERSGFLFIRQSLRMVIELDGALPTPDWPKGITVRSMIAGQEERAVFAVSHEAFRDHWGFVDSPFEEEFARFEHFIRNKTDYDPALFFLAMAGDEIAGISLCFPRSRDDEEMGWVATLGVRRPWRRRGIALALLHHSFTELWRRGKRRVGLGVDAQSLTGATRLYQKAGMHSEPGREVNIYEKELRPGEELSMQSIGE